MSFHAPSGQGKTINKNLGCALHRRGPAPETCIIAYTDSGIALVYRR